MADVQTRKAVQGAGRREQGAVQGAGRREQGAWMLPVVIALLAVSIMAAAALVVVLLTDKDGTTRTVTNTRTIVLPALAAQDIAAAKAMKDEAKIAVAISTPSGPSTPLSEGQKVQAAQHALTVRSIGPQQMLTGRDNRFEIASGTAAKDESGVAAAIGNSAP
jgi:hypothetical protein